MVEKATAEKSIEHAIELHEGAMAALEGGRWAEAEAAALESRRIFEREDGPESPDVANICNLLSGIAEAQVQYAAALEYAHHAWDLMQRLGSRCEGPEAESIRLEALARVGTALRCAGRYTEAEAWFLRAIERAESVNRELPAALNNLGMLYKYSGNFDAAEPLYRRALTLVEENSEFAASLYHNLGGLAHARGDFAAGEADGRRAWEIRRAILGPDHTDTLADACAYAAILDGLERYEESEPIYRHALSIFEERLGPDHLEIAVNLNNLAAVRRERGDLVEAEAFYKRALAMKEKLFGAVHPDTALTACNYASLLDQLGRVEEARPMARAALTALEAALSESHPRVVAARELWNTIRG